MQNGNLADVAAFLEEGTAMNMRSQFQERFKSGNKSDESISVIEYACLLEQPEMLHLLVTYEKDQRPKQYVR